MSFPLLKNITISDEKLKQVIIEVFEQKFSYFQKKDFLRWLNNRNLSERIKRLTVELMTEEEKKTHPTWAGYYTGGTDKVRLRNLNEKDTADHELNHFLNDYTNQFPRFINEGITEFLSQKVYGTDLNTTRNIAYYENVMTARFLYSIFGDELIKCYLVGVTPEFKEKLEKYLTIQEGDNLKDFYNTLESIHNNLYPDFEPSREELANRREKLKKDYEPKKDNYLENILLNATINEMLNYKYYVDSRIDYVSLITKIDERIDYYKYTRNKVLTLEEKIKLLKRILVAALCNSYLSEFYSKEEIIEKVNKCLTISENNRISVSLTYLTNLEEKTHDTDYYALKNKLDNYDYNSKNGFDYATFILDYFSLISTNKFETSSLDIEKNLYNLLYKRIKGNINNDLVNTLLQKYRDFYLSLGELNNHHLNKTIESSIIDFTLYDDYKMYLEKRDNSFYVITYNTETNKTEIKQAIQRKSSNKKYPYEIVYYDEFTKRSYCLLLDEDMLAVSYNNRIIPFTKGLNSIINNLITDELYLKNISEYIYYLKDGEYLFDTKDVAYVGGGIDDIDHRSRFINYEDLLNDLRNRISFLSENSKRVVVENTLRLILRKCYSGMKLSDEIISRIISNSLIYINTNNNLEHLNRINVDLIKEWKEYIKAITPTGLLYFKNKEDSEKYFKKTRRKEILKKATSYAKENYYLFIEEPNDLAIDQSIVTHNIKGISILTSELRDYSSPKAKKVDFKKLIDTLIILVEEERIEDQRDTLDFYYTALEPYLFGRSNNEEIIDLGELIYNQVKQSVFNHKEANISELEEYQERMLTIYLEEREQILSRMKKAPLKYEEPNTLEKKAIFEKIKSIEEDSMLSPDLKRREIMLLIELIEELDTRKEYESVIAEMKKTIASTKNNRQKKLEGKAKK